MKKTAAALFLSLVASGSQADIKVTLDPATVCSDPANEVYEFNEYRTFWTNFPNGTSPSNVEYSVTIHRCLSSSNCYAAQGAISGGNLAFGASSTPYTVTYMSWTVGVCHVSGN